MNVEVFFACFIDLHYVFIYLFSRSQNNINKTVTKLFHFQLALESNEMDSSHGLGHAVGAVAQGHDFHDIELSVLDPRPPAYSGW